MKSKSSFFKSKAFKMAISFSIELFIVMLIFSTALVWFLSLQIKSNQKKGLNYTVEVIERYLTELKDTDFIPPDSSAQTNLLPKVEGLSRIPGFIYYSVYNKDTKQHYYFSKDYLIDLKPAENAASFYQKNFDESGDLTLYYLTKEENFPPYGNIVIVTALNMARNEQSQILNAFPPIMLMFAMPLLIIAFLVALFITKRTLKPVSKITESVPNFSIDMNYRFPVTDAQDEFDKLSKTFNTLFEQIQKDFDREKQFTSDVSHELKTPLAVIQGHANLIKRWGKNDPAQLEKSLGYLTAEVDSMKYIIENLLKLSRLDRGTTKLNIEKVCLIDLLNRLKDDTLAWAKNSSITIKTDLSQEQLDSLTINTDKELMYEAWTNIISNSVKFCTDHNPVLTFTIEASDKIKLTFSDNGPGIPAESIPFIFDRFYRADSSHNRKIAGNGLGLSIVKTIADYSGATVECKSTLGQGTDMIFTF